MAEKATGFSLHYVGELSPENIDARELIQVLTAFANITTKAGQVFYGADAPTSFKIAHVQPGSIDIRGLIEFAAGLQPTFALLPSLALDVKDVPHLIKAWLDILKFLKGQPPQTIQKVDNGNAVQIKNSKGDVQIMNGNVYNTLVFNNVGKDAAKLNAPTRRGSKKLNLVQGKRKIASYNAIELSEFKPIRPADIPIESKIQAIVEVISPVLDGDGMWRFRYGQMRLTAKLTDDDYYQKILKGEESFRHGDRLKVQLETVQENLGSKISTKHFVTKVIERA